MIMKKLKINNIGGYYEKNIIISYWYNDGL